MMPEIAMSVLDIAQNSVRAEASLIEIDIAADQAADTLTVTIIDNGCGMTPEQLHRVTEPFYMVDKSRARSMNGSGIGLALCARIAELHGSTLHFESEPGVGTRCSFCLPQPPNKEQ